MNKNNLKIEIWKDISGFNGDYQINQYGEVKSFKRNNPIKLSPGINSDGYQNVILHKNKRINIKVHKLVVEAFIRKLKKNEQINHKNGIKTDNRLSNLEITSPKENVGHAWKMGFCERTRISTSKTGKRNRKKIRCVETGIIYKSIKDAILKTGLSSIKHAVRGKYKHAGGYTWEYYNSKSN